jgi:iron complex outermembrane receptor protein
MDFFGTPYKPTTGQQYEAGIKYQPAGGRTLITLSAFDLTQQNRQTADPDPTHVGSFFQTGEVRIRGIEVESRTEIARGLNVIAAYSHLNDEVTKSATASEIGHHVAQTPADQASLWAMYEVQSGPFAGLGFGGGARYIGHTFDVANTTVTPDYALYDARIQYDLSYLSPQWKGATLAINGLNLADKYYLTECTTGQGCTLGYRRTVLATLTYRW